MYGVISNNLKNQIDRYLSNKNINVLYTYTKQVKRYQELDMNNLENIDTLIVDSSTFYTDKECLESLFYIKKNYSKLRVILISFSNPLLVKAAMIGIYDFIKFEKKINLEYELDSILLNPRTLSDISDILNLNTLIEGKKGTTSTKIIALIGCNEKVFQTTLLIALLSSSTINEKVVLVIFYEEDEEINLFLSNMEEITIDNSFRTNNEFKFPIIFLNKETEREDILKLILSCSAEYETIYFDINTKSLSKLEGVSEFVTNYWLFERNDIISDKSKEVKKVMDNIEHNKITKKINVNDIRIRELERDIEKITVQYIIILKKYFPEFFIEKSEKKVKKFIRAAEKFFDNKKNVLRH